MRYVQRAVPHLGFVAALLIAGCATAPTPPVEVSPRGAINEDVTQANIQQTICVPGWTATVRPSTTYTNGIKAKLLREQGLPLTEAPKYVLDHLIPLALGGHPRKIENLQLQRWDGQWNAKVKDHLEVKLKAMVCRGELALDRARSAIATDWVGAYRIYVNASDAAVEVVEPAE